MANSRQIALRTRLRHHYWLTDCKPITETTVALQRRKMALIDAQDTMTEEQVEELLSEHYGFARCGEGWRIPDLDEARGVAVQSITATREAASRAGKASAAKRAAQAAAPAQAPEPVLAGAGLDDPDDF